MEFPSSDAETFTGGALSAPGTGPRVSRIASVDFTRPSTSEPDNSIDITKLPVRARGQFADVIKDIEKHAQRRWKAVYLFGLLSGKQVRIGVTADAKDLKQTGQSWHAEEVMIHGLLWCESTHDAEQIVKMLKVDLIQNHIRGAWYDLAPEYAQAAVEFAARKAGISIYTSEQRARAIEQTAYQVIRKAHPGLLTNVVPYNRRVS